MAVYAILFCLLFFLHTSNFLFLLGTENVVGGWVGWGGGGGGVGDHGVSMWGGGWVGGGVGGGGGWVWRGGYGAVDHGSCTEYVLLFKLPI